MKLTSVNVGAERPIRNAKSSGRTGIFKLPVDGPAALTPLGLAGDAIVDTENHGGPDQAIYLFTLPDYAWWSAHVGRSLEPGTFGENLTLSDLDSASLNVGDRLRIGRVLLEVTSPRIPCVTLAARMGDPAFVKKFRRAEKPGVYCRVIEAGDVQTGDPVELLPYQGTRVSMLEFFRAFYQRRPSPDLLRCLLDTPVHLKARVEYEALLAQPVR